MEPSSFLVPIALVVLAALLWMFFFRSRAAGAINNSTITQVISKVSKKATHIGIEYDPAPGTKTVTQRSDLVPISVNYHFTRQCNYSCGFCFHTAKTSHVETINNAKRGIKLLYDAGMKKINFAGGEPFLEAQMLGEMVQYCKEISTDDCPLAVSIVSNGSKITKSWIKKYGKHVDILAVSCDSFDEVINKDIGRGNGKDHVKQLFAVRDWCVSAGIKFKINTVVNSKNWEEDMNDRIAELAPDRWKVFQCLLLEGENDGNNTKRDARAFLIEPEQFKAFCDRHKEQKSLVPEDNEKMKTSYLILDEHMRFLDCTSNGKTPSASILGSGGVQAALLQSGFNAELFMRRGGHYDYFRENATSGCNLSKELEF